MIRAAGVRGNPAVFAMRLRRPSERPRCKRRWRGHAPHIGLSAHEFQSAEFPSGEPGTSAAMLHRMLHGARAGLACATRRGAEEFGMNADETAQRGPDLALGIARSDLPHGGPPAGNLAYSDGAEIASGRSTSWRAAPCHPASRRSRASTTGTAASSPTRRRRWLAPMPPELGARTFDVLTEARTAAAAGSASSRRPRATASIGREPPATATSASCEEAARHRA